MQMLLHAFTHARRRLHLIFAMVALSPRIRIRIRILAAIVRPVIHVSVDTYASVTRVPMISTIKLLLFL